MRSISAGAVFPSTRRANRRRVRPQYVGFARRMAVKTHISAARAMSMSMNGAAVRGFFGVATKAAGRTLRIAKSGLDQVLKVLYLLLCGLIWAGRPLVVFGRGAVSLLHAGIDAVRDYIQRHHKRQHGRAAPALMMAACTTMIFAAGYFGLGLEVKVNGISLGFVEDREQVTAVISEVEKRAGEYMGVPCVLTPEISYTMSYLDPENMLDTEALKNMMLASVSDKVSPQYVLRIDGQIIGGSASHAALESMLNRIMLTQRFFKEDMRTEFVQNVSIEPTSMADLQLMGVSDMEALLTSNTSEVQTYTIKNGDTISAVAKRHDVSVSEIKMMNPSLNIDRISIGEEIKLTAAVPYLSIRQLRTEQYQEEIPFETKVEKSDSMYVNQSKITTPGVPGLADVVADVIYVDGGETERDVLEFKVITEPTTQIKVVGTKPLPAKAATGKFRKPSNGSYSSGYGYRKNMGDFHTGVDFAGPVGSAIWAADGGTVSFAGWKGTYGYLVIINHGNGYQTYYGHCSKLLVTEGQKVAAGETIAKVGSTGRSTGPHVHFEVKVNGKNVNPLNYIGK